MGEQAWIATLERAQPSPSRHGVALEPFVLAGRPPHDEGVDRAEFSAKLRGVEPTQPVRTGRAHLAMSSSSRSLRRCSRQRRTLSRILLPAFLLTAGMNPTKRLP